MKVQFEPSFDQAEECVTQTVSDETTGIHVHSVYVIVCTRSMHAYTVLACMYMLYMYSHVECVGMCTNIYVQVYRCAVEKQVPKESLL